MFAWAHGPWGKYRGRGSIKRYFEPSIQFNLQGGRSSTRARPGGDTKNWLSLSIIYFFSRLGPALRWSSRVGIAASWRRSTLIFRQTCHYLHCFPHCRKTPILGSARRKIARAFICQLLALYSWPHWPGPRFLPIAKISGNEYCRWLWWPGDSGNKVQA